MTDFYFDELVDAERLVVETAALGAAAGTKLTPNDIGKAVKRGSAQNYVLCAGGDDIEGVLNSVSPETVNSGFSLGGVQRNGRKLAKIGANQAGNIAINALVVADTPSAVGTTDDGYPMVKAGTPTSFKWRVIRIVSGTGNTGSVVLIEKI